MLEVKLLGQFQIRIDGKHVDIPSRAEQSLLAYLVLNAGTAFRREHLAGLFWPDSDESNAKGYLRQALWRLRKSFTDTAPSSPDYFQANKISIAFDPGSAYRLDAAVLEDETADSLEDILASTQVYSGELLPGFYDEWAVLERERLRVIFNRIMHRLLEQLQSARRWQDLIQHAERWISMGDNPEPAYRALILGYAMLGDLSSAQAAYNRCRMVFERDLRVELSPETVLLAEKILSGEPLEQAAPGETIRGYQLMESIGQGGFGIVYRAQQPSVGREVAVKVIQPRYANLPDFIRRFEAEAQLVARLEHPYIVPLYDYWREPGAAFLVMRLMRGGSLHSRIKDGPLSLEFILRMLNQVGGALYAAHRMGVIHRDLKPANILLDEDQNTYLADFGVAKNLGNPEQTSDTMLAGIVGSPAYVSPEQIRAEPIRPQADIYALGILLFQLLTGQQPFKGPTSIDYVQQHLNQPIPPLLDYNPSLPPKLEPILERATAKNSADRYADIPSLVSDFQSAVASTGFELPENVSLDWLPADKVDLEDIENPYKGLRAFEEADSKHFFGRETLIQDLLGRMSEGNDLSRFLAVVGPSGSGKSSAVKAGLIPSLRRGGLPSSENWFIVGLTPGSHPYEELETALLRVAVNPPESLLGQLRQDERGLLRAVGRILPPDKLVELVLVIDQFEELFTLVEDETIRASFLESLVTAMLDPRSRLRVVLTLRADFTDRPLEYVDFGELLRQRMEFVLPLSPDELEAAITQPSRGTGLALEPGLSERIIRDLGGQPGTLPLLQYALTELFERRSGRRLTINAYEDSGGVLGALGKRAEEIYSSLEQPGQETARQVFLRLITLGEGVEDTRRRVLQAELEALTPPPSTTSRRGESETVPNALREVRVILDSFGRARLLSFDHDPITRSPTVEVAHEALLREWPRLREWLDQSLVDIRMQRVLARNAEEWEQSNREMSYLLHGSRLDQYAAWMESTDLILTFNERTFLEASLEDRKARRAAEATRQAREAALEKRVRRFLRALVVVLLLATLGSLGLAWAAREQANLATSRELAVMAINNLEVDPERSILLSLQALRTAHTRQAADALHRAVPASRVRMALRGDADEALSVEYSPDGTTIAAASNDEVFVYDSGDGQKLFSLPGRVAGYSQDGSLLAAGAQDGTVRILELATWEIIHILRGHSDWIDFVQFNPDGRMLVSQSLDDTFIVWDSESGEKLFTSNGVTSGYELPYSVAFSPDGRLLLSQDVYSTEEVEWKVWGVDQDWALLNQFSGTSMFVFSPDGRWLASLGGRGVSDIILWDLSKLSAAERAILDLSTLEPTRAPAAHDNVITGLDFSTDGTLLATASLDGTAKVWQISPDGLSLLMTLSGHKSEVTDVAFSPDSTRLVTTSYDGSVRIWDITPNGASEWFTLAAHSDAIHRFSLSEDGNYLATASQDMAKIWDLASGRELVAIHDPGSPLFGVDLSPDGSRLATGGSDSVARIWKLNLNPDTLSAELLRTLAGHAAGPPVGGIFNGLTAVVFSPDGTKLATGGEDKFAKVWDAESGQELLSVLVDTDGSGVTQLAFSPDGRYLATASDSIPSGSVLAIIWDIASGKEVSTFTGHNLTGRIWGIAFSPDGKRVATGGEEGALKIWDPATGEELLNLSGHASSVNGVSFSPDGKYLVSASPDGSARVWDAASGEELQAYNSPGGAFDNARFTPDGKNVIVSAGGGFVYGYFFDTQDLISLAKSRLTRGFTPDECRQYLHSDTCPVEP